MTILGFKLPKLELIADWKTIAKLPSMWLGIFASAVTGFILANPTTLFAVIAFFPPERQLPAAIMASLLILFLIGATRLIKFNWNHDIEDAPSDGSSNKTN